jgi:hypothetical protein
MKRRDPASVSGLGNDSVQRVVGKRWSYAPAAKAFVWPARAQEQLHVYRPWGTLSFDAGSVKNRRRAAERFRRTVLAE